MNLPDDLPVERRSAVRLVVLDDRGQVLLFHTRDPARPALGRWWELPDVGIDGDESYVDTALLSRPAPRTAAGATRRRTRRRTLRGVVLT